MNAMPQDDYSAEADLPCQADALIATITDQVRQDKLHARIATLESRLRYGWVVVIAVWLLGAVMGKLL